MLNDITRCLGRGCPDRHTCARYIAPIPENVSLSWVSDLNPERAKPCPSYIPVKPQFPPARIIRGDFLS